MEDAGLPTKRRYTTRLLSLDEAEKFVAEQGGTLRDLISALGDGAVTARGTIPGSIYDVGSTQSSLPASSWRNLTDEGFERGRAVGSRTFFFPSRVDEDMSVLYRDVYVDRDELAVVFARAKTRERKLSYQRLRETLKAIPEGQKDVGRRAAELLGVDRSTVYRVARSRRTTPEKLHARLTRNRRA
jgi:hypothetical protein